MNVESPKYPDSRFLNDKRELFKVNLLSKDKTKEGVSYV